MAGQTDRSDRVYRGLTLKTLIGGKVKMARKIYTSDELTKGGPYSHVVDAGELLFVSGMLPVDIVSGEKEMDDVTVATELAFRNVRRALAAAGVTTDNIVKVTVFLRDMDYIAAMNEVYNKVFPENPPARSCVAVKTIPGNYPLEIEVIAKK